MIYIKLFFTFFKIGLVGFGGGLSILPLIYQGVSKFTYISEEEFANLFGISQATPGPIGINAATFVGYKAAGVGGAAAATIGAILPALILVAITMRLFTRYKEHSIVQGAMLGIRPATIGLMAAAVVYVSKGSIFAADFDLSICSTFSDITAGISIPSVIIAAASFLLVWKTGLGVIPIIILMGAVGALSAFI